MKFSLVLLPASARYGALGVAFAIYVSVSIASAQHAGRPPGNSSVCSACIRAHMNFLASDALRGRGSATPDELVAATYIASELQQYGVQPAAGNGQYVQKVPLVKRRFSAAPELRFSIPGASEPVVCKTGDDMIAMRVGERKSGPL